MSTPLPPLTPPPPTTDLAGELLRLQQLVTELRLHCPWDREQTLESLRHLTVEEVYELSEAILTRDRLELRKELGDLLLHVFFYANLTREQGLFDLLELTLALNEKLIRRHPHVYGAAEASDSQAVKQTWEQVKLSEQKPAEGPPSVLKGVPQSMPALVKAYRMQEKAAGVGFDWTTLTGVWEKVQEELQELQQAVAHEDSAAREEELGDLLFTLVNLARHLQLNPDDALEKANRKFRRRFQRLEALAASESLKLAEAEAPELDRLWQQVKAEERLSTPTSPQ